MVDPQSRVSVASACAGPIAVETVVSAQAIGHEQYSHRDSFREELRHHQYRVGEMTRLLAATVGFSSHYSATIGQAAALHDIGKLFMNSAVYQKPGRLTAEEEAEVRTHTTRGHWALMRGHDPISRLAARIALEHHEHWDGGGYPHRIEGTDISRETRVVTICDTYAALRERRAYKPEYSHDEAMSVMLCGDERLRPTMFDPTMLGTFLMHGELFRKWWETPAGIGVAA